MDYDWDSIKVAAPEFNNSKGFFRSRHPFHEASRLNEKLAAIRLNDDNIKIEPKQQLKQEAQRAARKSVHPNKQTSKSPSKDKENEMSSSNNKRAVEVQSTAQKPTLVKKPTVLKNLVTEMKTMLPSKADPGHSSTSSSTATAKNSATATFSVKIEKKPVPSSMKNRQIANVQLPKKQEFKARRYTKPTPHLLKDCVVPKKTAVAGKKIAKEKPLLQLTLSKRSLVPSCGDPDRLKFAMEKKKMFLAQFEGPRIQFKAKPASVLKKQPFQPLRSNTKLMDQKPFNLHLTSRLVQRQEFDKRLNATMAEKKKQEDVRKQRQDLEDRKFIRQKTAFHANPIRYNR